MIPINVQIRLFRLEQKKSGAEIARAAGIDAAHYWRIEEGDYSPTVYTLSKIAKALGVRILLTDKMYKDI